MAEAKSTEYISRKCCCHFVAVVELCQNMKITVILKQLRWTMLKQQSRLSTELVFGYAATLGHTCTMWEEIWNHQNVSKLLAMPFCFFLSNSLQTVQTSKLLTTQSGWLSFCHWMLFRTRMSPSMPTLWNVFGLVLFIYGKWTGL